MIDTQTQSCLGQLKADDDENENAIFQIIHR